MNWVNDDNQKQIVVFFGVSRDNKSNVSGDFIVYLQCISHAVNPPAHQTILRLR